MFLVPMLLFINGILRLVVLKYLFSSKSKFIPFVFFLGISNLAVAILAVEGYSWAGWVILIISGLGAVTLAINFKKLFPKKVFRVIFAFEIVILLLTIGNFFLKSINNV